MKHCFNPNIYIKKNRPFVFKVKKTPIVMPVFVNYSHSGKICRNYASAITNNYATNK